MDVIPLDVWTVSGSCLVQINDGCYGNGMMFVSGSLKHSAVAHSIAAMRRLLEEKKTALDGSRTANSQRTQEENLNISKRTLQNY